MNETDRATLKQQIETLLAELEADDARRAEGRAVVKLDQQMVGRLSRMDALQQQAMAQAQSDRRSVEAQRLKAALLRFEEGEYGYCSDCGEEIAVKRLQLDPAVPTCISCARG